MKLADKSVYPIQTKIKMGETLSLKQSSGLTYKQWLVGMLASNSQIVRKIEINEDYEHYAEILMLQADAIISELEKEQSL